MSLKILKSISGHKIVAALIVCAVAVGGYFGYYALIKGQNTTRYRTAAVEKGTLIVSVSGSGQVSASQQMEIKPEVKSRVVAVYAGEGEEVKAGKLLVNLDETDFQKALQDVEIALETAKLELDELLSPADELTVLKAENAVLQAKNSLETLKIQQEKEHQQALQTIQEAEEDIERAYEDTLNSITSVFWDLPAVVAGTGNILYSYELAKSETTINDYDWNLAVYQNSFAAQDKDELEPFIENAISGYNTSKDNYDKNFEDYKKVGYYSQREVVEDLLNETIDTAKSIAQAIKNEATLISFIIDYFSGNSRPVYKKISDYEADLKTYGSKVNNHYSALLSIQRTVQDSQEAKLKAEDDLAEMERIHPLDLAAAEIGLKEKEKTLEDLKAGPDELDIRAKRIALRQKEDALVLAKQNLAYCNVFAPFDGVVTEVKIKKNDSVSAGQVLATLITKQKIAEITLNEVDIAKVKIGQKANITFDALEDLNITGEVKEVNTLGTATQGVVTYGVKIVFDTDADYAKPGMSITANIITEAKQDVLVLPNSAIKSQGESYYVELVEAPDETKQQLLANVSGIALPTSPKMLAIEIGLSNDLSTEIVSGLEEGDVVVSSTVNQSNNQTSQSQRNREFGMPGMGGGAMFIR